MHFLIFTISLICSYVEPLTKTDTLNKTQCRITETPPALFANLVHNPDTIFCSCPCDNVSAYDITDGSKTSRWWFLSNNNGKEDSYKIVSKAYKKEHAGNFLAHISSFESACVSLPNSQNCELYLFDYEKYALTFIKARKSPIAQKLQLFKDNYQIAIESLSLTSLIEDANNKLSSLQTLLVKKNQLLHVILSLSNLLKSIDSQFALNKNYYHEKLNALETLGAWVGQFQKTVLNLKKDISETNFIDVHDQSEKKINGFASQPKNLDTQKNLLQVAADYSSKLGTYLAKASLPVVISDFKLEFAQVNNLV